MNKEFYCPGCGQKLADAECRHTSVDEVSLGGAERDRVMTVCACDRCDGCYGVVKISQAAEDDGAW
ncbi:hypothetical protein [Candidatus Darwinibacter acetoxidans]